MITNKARRNCRSESRAQIDQVSHDSLAENLTLDSLRSRIAPADKHAAVYSYVIKTVGLDSGYSMAQYGSGPNFRGDFITLCTCKHQMRTYLSPTDWRGTWVAGFTSSRGEFHRLNWLVYLIKVGEAYLSHRDLVTEFRRLRRERTLQEKAANRHTCGDIFIPRTRCTNPYDPEQYLPPTRGHSHEVHTWRKDIDYSRWNRRAALLVGDRCHSYRWNQPMIVRSAAHRLPRGNPKSRLFELLNVLEISVLAEARL